MTGLCNQDQDSTEQDKPGASEGMSLQEKLDRWSHHEKSQDNQRLDGDEDELDTRIGDHGRCSEDGIGPDFDQVTRYREVLLGSPAFEWLASSIVREARTTAPETDSAGHIRSQIPTRHARRAPQFQQAIFLPTQESKILHSMAVAGSP